jgi:hypothetical protein
MTTAKNESDEIDPRKFDLMCEYLRYLAESTPSKRNQVLDCLKVALHPPKKRGRPRKPGFPLEDFERLKAQISELTKKKPTDRNVVALLQVGAMMWENAAKRGRNNLELSDKPAAHRVNAPEKRSQQKTLRNTVSKARKAK